MPRAEKSHIGSQYYHSQFSNSQYLPDSSTSSGSPPMSPASSHPGSQTPSSSAPSVAASASSKKKHVCPTCERAFTTSGHLARHSRVHTGERNHKCPFPGCETRCSRQDNLQQHYRIHLSPGSRRSSARSTNSRKRGPNSASTGSASVEPTPIPPPMSPPPLEQAHVYPHSPPPDSPPPLAQATLPATAALPVTHSRLDGNTGRLSASSSPETTYTTPNGAMHQIGSQGVGISHSAQLNYNYRSGTTTYQEQSQPTGNGYTSYVHTTPVANPNGANNFASYGNSHSNFGHQSQTQTHNRNSPPAPMHSRHSISHINNPHYPPSASNAAPPSPASSHSVSSHTSAPPTPTYAVSYDDGQTYHHAGNSIVADHSGQVGSQSHLVSNNYTTVPHASRFNSPPPTLAPIQNERYIRQEEPRHAASHNASPYIHHPQPLSNEYSYHQSMALGHGAWKTDGMRKGVGTTVV